MNGITKKIIGFLLTATLVVGSVSVVFAGTDVSSGVKWTNYSIMTKEDHKDGEKTLCWYHSLIDAGNPTLDQHYVTDLVTDAQINAINKRIDEDNKNRKKPKPHVARHAENEEWSEFNCYRCFGEWANITSNTPSDFVMDVKSTGWSAKYGPSPGKYDDYGDLKYEIKGSNPWGVTATKVVKVNRGYTYNISFNIKSTLWNMITKTVERDGKEGRPNDGTAYNVPTGYKNYTKHFHIKAYDDKDKGGAALPLQSITATCDGKDVLARTKEYDNLIPMNGKSEKEVTVKLSVIVPPEKADYQKGQSQPTMGIKFAFGAFLFEFPNENNMTGKITVSNFKCEQGSKAKAPAKVKIKKVTAGKKKLTIKINKVKGAYKYQYQASLKKNFKKIAKKKTTNKTKLTLKLKRKKKYYVRVRAINNYNTVKVYGPWSKTKSKKTK